MCDTLPNAYRKRLVTARLPHDCYSCGYPIIPGETYHHASGVWDGRGDDYRRHELCAVLEEGYSGEHSGCWTFGALREGVNSTACAVQRAWAAVMRTTQEESV
jgi:hypothetical protein